MKHLSFLISLLFVLLLTACGTTIYLDGVRVDLPDRVTSAPTATATATASPVPSVGLQATTRANVNLRTEPTTAAGNASIIRLLFTGTEITLIARNPAGDWAKTSEGWVYTQNLNIIGNVNALPVFIPPIPTVDPTPTQEVRSGRVGYNINGLTYIDRPNLLPHMTALCSSALVMDNLILADEIYTALAACDNSPPLVVHRSYDFDEGSEWANEPDSENISQWNREGYKHLVRYCTNEPSYGGNQSLEQFVDYHVRLMAAARANGITLACGNFAVGTIRWEDIAAGRYDPFLRAINDYDHYLGCHEYTQTVLAFGVSQWPREWLLNRELVQPANWPSASQVPLAMAFDPIERTLNYPKYYHLRRCDWFLLRADQIGIQRPQIILTEFGWDSLSDIKPTIETLRWQYGLPQYMFDLRGVNTYARLWAWYWPQWTFGRAACEQIKWAESIYPKEYIAFYLFFWTSPLDSHWSHTDFSGRENPAHYELQDCLEAA